MEIRLETQPPIESAPKPPVDIITKVLFWPGLTWRGQNGTFVLMSTGGLAQPDVSPCTVREGEEARPESSNLILELRCTGNEIA